VQRQTGATGYCTFMKTLLIIIVLLVVLGLLFGFLRGRRGV
jgi:hypothetical protein